MYQWPLPLQIYWAVQPLAPTLRNGQHNITPSPYPYKYIEPLKACPLPLQVVVDLWGRQIFEAEGK